MGPTYEETNERFIFEKQLSVLSSKPKYVEIFTEIKKTLDKDNTDDGFHFACFDKEYITNEKDITEYLNEEEIKSGFVSKHRLLKIYNLMNFEKEISQIKIKK
jgi:hypothetical protein